jgi:hypothetical protein
MADMVAVLDRPPSTPSMCSPGAHPCGCGAAPTSARAPGCTGTGLSRSPTGALLAVEPREEKWLAAEMQAKPTLHHSRRTYRRARQLSTASFIGSFIERLLICRELWPFRKEKNPFRATFFHFERLCHHGAHFLGYRNILTRLKLDSFKNRKHLIS